MSENSLPAQMKNPGFRKEYRDFYHAILFMIDTGF